MAERDSKGHFLPGNKTSAIGGKSKQFDQNKRFIKSEIIKCAETLMRPAETLFDDMNKVGVSRLELLTIEAITKKNYKFIQWLLEMAVGRPQQSIDGSIVNIDEERKLKTMSDEELAAKLRLVFDKKSEAT